MNHESRNKTHQKHEKQFIQLVSSKYQRQKPPLSPPPPKKIRKNSKNYVIPFTRFVVTVLRIERERKSGEETYLFIHSYLYVYLFIDINYSTTIFKIQNPKSKVKNLAGLKKSSRSKYTPAPLPRLYALVKGERSMHVPDE